MRIKVLKSGLICGQILLIENYIKRILFFEKQRLRMAKKTQFFINGKWLTSENQQAIDLINPATEICNGQLQLGNEKDVDKAVSAAKNALPKFSASPLESRIGLLERISNCYKARFADIGASISREMGAPLKFSVRFQASCMEDEYSI